MLKRTPAAHQIMKRVDSLAQVPVWLRPLYDVDDAYFATTKPFKLGPASGVLRRPREHVAKDDGNPLSGRTSPLTKTLFGTSARVVIAQLRKSG